MRAASRPLAVLFAGLLLLAARPADAEHVTLPAGARLHLEPDPSSPALTMLDEETLVEVLERKDDWVRVGYGTWRGWAREAAPVSLLSERGGPNVPQEWVAGTLLARARSLLRDGGREVPFARRTLVTDVRDDALLARLEEAVLAATASLGDRWRLRVPVKPGSYVFLFESAEAGRRLGAVACGPVGPAGSRVVSLALAGDGETPTLERLLHQVGHLYARELLGDGVPNWVEEGMADAFVEGGTSPSRSRWSRRPLPVRPASSLPPPSVAELIRAGPELFERGPAGEALRAETISFFRYLSDPWLPRFRPFRSYLRRGNGGKPLDQPALEKALGESLAGLERTWRAYRGRGEQREP